MKRLMAVVAVAVVCVAFAGRAVADPNPFAFTFTSDPGENPLVASGWLTVNEFTKVTNADQGPVGFAYGFLATDGGLTMSTVPNTDYGLVPTVSGGWTTDAAGGFQYDNLVYPKDDASGKQLVDLHGLLFGKVGATPSYVNICYDTYNGKTAIFVETNENGYVYRHGTLELTEVPEPAFFQLTALLGLGGLALLRMRRSK